MRLVDIDHFKSVAAGHIGKDLNKLIEKEPTIDPVRQGRWEYKKDGAGGMWAVCSECHYNTFLIMNGNYCPNCGAHMINAE